MKQDGSNYQYLYDGKGNVAGVLDASQQTVASYRYDVFGNLLQQSGTLDQPFMFSTKRYLAGPGLNYYGYRFYQPSVGRWLKRDPLQEAGGLNLYGFVLNNPVNKIDPWGLMDAGHLNWMSSAMSATNQSSGKPSGGSGGSPQNSNCPVGLVGISGDFYPVGAGAGGDAGIYWDTNTGEWGFYFAVEGGAGEDNGASFESGYADSVDALSGPYGVVEGGGAGVSVNHSQSPNGETVTTVNVGFDNAGLPTGHGGAGHGWHLPMGNYK
ncbi:MAG: RHS repeat-associated core domain-containing protein [Desulfobacteraceae bacterium]|nr:RHS repeat-associated core domain-containing protein [Desulfobacteraceae bacterium]